MSAALQSVARASRAARAAREGADTASRLFREAVSRALDEGRSEAEVARAAGLSRERVRQLRARRSDVPSENGNEP